MSFLDGQAVNPPDGQSTSSQGPGVPGNPPGPGTGTGTCLEEHTKIARVRGNGIIEYIPAKYLGFGDRIFGRDNNWVRVKAVTFHDSADIWQFTTENGATICCTGTHKLIAPQKCDTGTPAAKLNVGDFLLTWKDGEEVESEIISKLPQPAGRVVHVTLDQAGHWKGHHYAAGEADAQVFQSNAKPIMGQGEPF